MNNIPKKIFLQIGEECEDDISFDELDHEFLTWAEDKIFNNDISYVLESILVQKDAEIQRLKDLLQHEIEKWHPNPEEKKARWEFYKKQNKLFTNK